MKEQIIVAIGREHGSGGHYIAELVSKALGIKLYDKKTIEAAIVDQGYSQELISQKDERPVNFFASRRIGKFSNSIEVNVAERTFQMLRTKAAQGESFVVLGRCGEQVLKDNPNCINVFICADRADRIKRIAERYDVSEKKALDRIKRMDRERKYYYETHTGQEWGSISSHDILLNASLLGIEGTVNVLEGIYKR